MPKQKPPASDFSFNHLDRLPELESTAELLRERFVAIASFYNFEKIATSVFEDPKILAPLSKANMLQERPPVIVKAQGSGIELMLCPSASLGLLRAYRTHKMNDLPHPIKLFFEQRAYWAAGNNDEAFRMREEAGLAMIGEEGPIAEAQIVQVMYKALADMGVALDRAVLVVNAPGCHQCFPGYRNALSSYVRPKVAALCKNCKRDQKTQPTNILSCKEEKCMVAAAHAPQILDFLCDTCKKHLRGFFEFLDEMGIPYVVDTRRFRLGSWFNSLIFEFRLTHGAKPKEVVPEEGSVPADTVIDPEPVNISGTIFAEGGRLSRAGEVLNGKRIDVAVGILFLDTISMLLANGGGTAPQPAQPKVFLAQLGELARRRSLEVMEVLRAADIPVRESLGRDAIKSQLKVAEIVGAELALIVGQKEAIDDTIIIREVDSGIQETVPQEKLIDFLRRRLKK